MLDLAFLTSSTFTFGEYYVTGGIAEKYIHRERDHIDSRDYTSSSKSTKDFVWRSRLLLSLFQLGAVRSRRLFVSAHRVLTLQSNDGRRRGR